MGSTLTAILVGLALLAILTTSNDERIETLKSRYYEFLDKLPPQYDRIKSKAVITGTFEPSDIGTNVAKGGEILVCLDGHDPNDTFHILIHELAHSNVSEYDHSNSFWDTYRDLRRIAISEGYYTPFDKKKYCGKTITDSV
jgi:hypothetical protein